MGFYLRKNIRVGPLRFNLSNSGVNVSAGVAGLRFGTGPRGNYVRMGGGGLYYQATLPPPKSQGRVIKPPPEQASPPIPSGTHGPLEEIESADVSQIVDSSSRELLDELNQKQRKTRLWPLAAVISIIVLMLGTSSDWPSWLLTILLIAMSSGTYALYIRDALAKTVVLFYDFDTDMEAAYGRLHATACQLATSANTQRFNMY